MNKAYDVLADYLSDGRCFCPSCGDNVINEDDTPEQKDKAIRRHAANCLELIADAEDNS